METKTFVMESLGCDEMDSEFINSLHADFPSAELCDKDVVECVRNCVANDYFGLGTELINKMFDNIIEKYVGKGLDKEKFVKRVDSIHSTLSYDGKTVSSDSELDFTVGILNCEEDPSYLEEQVMRAIDRAEEGDYLKHICTEKEVRDNAFEILEFMPNVTPEDLPDNAYEKAVCILVERIVG